MEPQLVARGLLPSFCIVVHGLLPVVHPPVQFAQVHVRLRPIPLDLQCELECLGGVIIFVGTHVDNAEVVGARGLVATVRELDALLV